MSAKKRVVSGPEGRVRPGSLDQRRSECGENARDNRTDQGDTCKIKEPRFGRDNRKLPTYRQGDDDRFSHVAQPEKKGRNKWRTEHLPSSHVTQKTRNEQWPPFFKRFSHQPADQSTVCQPQRRWTMGETSQGDGIQRQAPG